MTNPKYSCEVFAYDTKVVPPIWSFNERLTLEFMEGDLSHPDAVRLRWPGSGDIIVPMSEFVEAVKWIEQARPRP